MSKPEAQNHDLQSPASRGDLIRLVLQPLSRHTNQSWQDILQKIQEVKDAVEIIAREMARQKAENEVPSTDSKAEG